MIFLKKLLLSKISNLQSPYQHSHNSKAILLNVVCTRDYGIQSVVVLLLHLFCVGITGIVVFVAVRHVFGSFGSKLQHQILSEHF